MVSIRDAAMKALEGANPQDARVRLLARGIRETAAPLGHRKPQTAPVPASAPTPSTEAAS
jgi:hypothetical protein